MPFRCLNPWAAGVHAQEPMLLSGNTTRFRRSVTEPPASGERRRAASSDAEVDVLRLDVAAVGAALQGESGGHPL
jgi:hypothetical protein